MLADCDFYSSGESGSDGSYARSQEHNGNYVLQKRSLDEPSGPEGNGVSTMNVYLGHPEGNGVLGNAPTSTTLMMVPEKPVLSTPSLNIGMDYWSGSMVPSGHEGLKSQCVLGAHAPVTGTMAFSGPNRDGGGSTEMWVQDDREQKREKRKQANRESARRSRMRKQFEYEELAEKVASLTAENDSLKLEVNKLGDLYKKLSSENSSLLERIHKIQG